MFINDDTLIQATGYKYPARQEKWCKDNGLPCKRNAKGAVNVLVEDYIKKFGLKNYKHIQKEQEPEFDAIRNINGKKAKKIQGAAT
jgi:hypothetical protein